MSIAVVAHLVAKVRSLGHMAEQPDLNDAC